MILNAVCTISSRANCDAAFGHEGNTQMCEEGGQNFAILIRNGDQQI